MIQFISNMNFWHFVVLKSDLLSEAEVLQTANECKIGSYYPEMYRFPKYDIIKLLHTDPDVTNQLLNSAQALDSPSMTKKSKEWLKIKRISTFMVMKHNRQ